MKMGKVRQPAPELFSVLAWHWCLESWVRTSLKQSWPTALKVYHRHFHNTLLNKPPNVMTVISQWEQWSLKNPSFIWFFWEKWRTVIWNFLLIGEKNILCHGYYIASLSTDIVVKNRCSHSRSSRLIFLNKSIHSLFLALLSRGCECMNSDH